MMLPSPWTVSETRSPHSMREARWLIHVIVRRLTPRFEVESRMGAGSLGHAASLRFPSPLIEPDVRISRIRLSDWFHREAHGEDRWPQASPAQRDLSFAFRY